MKYAVALPADQTITYLVNDKAPFDDTINHTEAMLWDDKDDADRILKELNGPSDERYCGWIEDVEDEAEFRRRTDTW